MAILFPSLFEIWLKRSINHKDSCQLIFYWLINLCSSDLNYANVTLSDFSWKDRLIIFHLAEEFLHLMWVSLKTKTCRLGIMFVQQNIRLTQNTLTDGNPKHGLTELERLFTENHVLSNVDSCVLNIALHIIHYVFVFLFFISIYHRVEHLF